jgi:hypothetical protein
MGPSWHKGVPGGGLAEVVKRSAACGPGLLGLRTTFRQPVPRYRVGSIRRRPALPTFTKLHEHPEKPLSPFGSLSLVLYALGIKAAQPDATGFGGC